jgi:O-antigen ligase
MIGIIIGVDVANESYGLAVFVALISAWIILEKTCQVPPDAFLLAIVVVGYVVGNRGFAQLQPSPELPLLPAEAMLAVAVPALILRMVLKKATAVRRDLLNYSILAWILFGVIRLPLDMRHFGVMALRDFAMVYYSAFFFIAQAFGDNATSFRVLTRSLTVAFVCLIPVVISIQISPDFLIDHLTWRGIPIIYHKSDLIATSLAGGFFWFWTRQSKTGKNVWALLAAASILLIGVMASPRSAMAGITMTTLLWLFTGRWRIAAAQIGIISTAAILTVAALSFAGKDLRTSIPYSVYEHAISIFDPEGTGSYINGESGDPGGNNQFRLIWWRDVIDETLSTSPVFGLGFGADLSTRFLADYDLLSDDSFAARSPHSMVITVLGRMGILGLVLWLAISAGMARLIWRLFKGGDSDGMGLASLVCVVWVSACVGVVLEGPMGAVLFWTALGLANSKISLGIPAPVPAADSRPVIEPADAWPVAKAGVFDIKSGNP